MIVVRRSSPYFSTISAELVADDRALPLRPGQDVLQVGDDPLELGQLVDDPLPLQGRQPAQLHVEDRGGLHLVDLQQRHQTRTGVVGARAAPDQGDDLVEHVQRLDQRPVDVGLGLGVLQPVLGPPLDDLDLVRDPEGDELVQPQRARHVVDQGQHVAPEGVLQLGVLVEVVQHHPRLRVPLQHDHQPLTRPGGGVVPDVGDTGQLAGVHQLGDLERQVVRVDHVRQLGDHQQGPPAAVFLDVDDRAHDHRAATGPVRVLDPLAPDDQRPVGEVGTLHPLQGRLEQLLGAGLGVLQRPLHGGGDLTQVVGRDVGGHADGDAGRAVDQQVREPGRQDDRLLLLAVVVRLEVDGVLADVADHLHGQLRHPALGVPHGRGLVVARRPEVALTGDQRIAHHPRLRQPDQGVVDGPVTVRVVLTHHLADHTRALVPAAVRPVATVEHRVQDPPVHRLQPVPRIRQRPPHDHAHRVVQVGLLDLVLQIHRLPAIRRLVSHITHRSTPSFVSRDTSPCMLILVHPSSPTRPNPPAPLPAIHPIRRRVLSRSSGQAPDGQTESTEGRSGLGVG